MEKINLIIDSIKSVRGGFIICAYARLELSAEIAAWASIMTGRTNAAVAGPFEPDTLLLLSVESAERENWRVNQRVNFKFYHRPSGHLFRASESGWIKSLAIYPREDFSCFNFM